MELPPESVAITLPVAADVADVVSPFMYSNNTRAVDAPLDSVPVQTYGSKSTRVTTKAANREA